MNFEETAGLTEEMFESEDATTTLLNVSESVMGQNQNVKAVANGTIGDAGTEAANHQSQSVQLQIVNPNQNISRNPRLSLFSEKNLKAVGVPETVREELIEWSEQDVKSYHHESGISNNARDRNS